MSAVDIGVCRLFVYCATYPAAPRTALFLTGGHRACCRNRSRCVSAIAFSVSDGSRGVLQPNVWVRVSVRTIYKFTKLRLVAYGRKETWSVRWCHSSSIASANPHRCYFRPPQGYGCPHSSTVPLQSCPFRLSWSRYRKRPCSKWPRSYVLVCTYRTETANTRR